jgi:hypothetical protein
MALEEFEHRISTTWSGGNGSVTATQIVKGGGEDNRNIELAGNAADVQVDLAFATARLKSFFIVADQGVILATNSSATPADAFTLAAGVPLVWTEGTGIENPFGADVTKIYLSNGTAEVAAVQLRVLIDPTP